MSRRVMQILRRLAPDGDVARPVQPWQVLLGALIYAAVVAALASRHELWRDEVRALNIAAGSRSLVELFDNLRNEGHPALWYLLLYAGFHATGSMLVLKPISALIAVASMVVFFRCAPWPGWQKALFAAGLFPLYEYSVMCRNYGIGMLLLFATAVLYRGRFTRPLPLAIALALLANTNAYALVVVIALVIALTMERRLAPRARACGRAESLGALLLVVLGVGCSVWTMYPDRSTAVTGLHALRPAALPGPLAFALLCPGRFLFQSLLEPSASVSLRVLGGASSLGVTVALWLLAASLRPRVWLLAALLAAAAGFSLLSDLVYPSQVRHWGLLLLLVVVLLWMQDEDRASEGARGPSALPRLQGAARSLLLVTHVGLAVAPVRADLFGAFSSSERLGAYVAETPALRDATLIGEPDYLLEALPYYVPNPIYQPREGHHLLKVNFTSARQPVLSLADLMTAATGIGRQTGRPVLIALGHDLQPEGPFVLPAGYTSTFTYSPASLHDFLLQAERLTRFEGAGTDENYTLYLWRGTERLARFHRRPPPDGEIR
jgi:hypothetical protein